MAVMLLRPLPAKLALVALACFTIWITWRAKSLELSTRDAQTKPVMVGKQAPDFQLVALDGRKVSLAEFRGKKKVVISFWASWCGPCRTEMPVMRRFYQTTHSDAAKYEFLAINVDDERDAAETAAKHDKMPFPVLIDSTGSTARDYKVEAIPTLLVVNEEGNVDWGETGFQPTSEIFLAAQLGIKNYAPQIAVKDDVGEHDANHH
jgi:peroxiredoxin